jgi:two-component system response regulator HydG
MPQVTGIDILSAVREQDPMTPVILMTAQASLQTAIQAVNQGAFYYIQKPFANDELVAILRRACDYRAVRVENKHLKQEIRRRDRTGVVRPIGKSKRFNEVLKLAEQVAPTDSTVLITGESGTGKEVIARYIHSLSNRTEGPCLSINCGALPENLLESELFGHVKGSFTGAVRDKQGLFAAARGGSFFLDEVGEMPPSLQIKLLRVLQEREAIPGGSHRGHSGGCSHHGSDQPGPRRGDAEGHLPFGSLLSAQRDRHQPASVAGTAGGHPAADRVLPESPRHGATDRTQGALGGHSDAVMVYEWPGNVRELENALEHAWVLSKANVIEPSALPERITKRKKEPLVSERSYANPTLDVIERAYIMYVLQSEGRNKTRAAEVLGIDPSTLYRKLSRYEEQPS